ncbi:hypothetical protein QFZ75_007267 [Streptomyces sp. V3I8]|uniref:hypothetical protein n=1 Tax=Streptomyces sp. V3I8 TaxID=3042279 RepID=UPI00277EC6D4|nr:hypothetical protein [Streptomyces sp. V3I8]MDQ1040851.1 hypothetical protein [Streptomyces sp. V3I8]
MPSWTTSRRSGATAALYAVFVGGWYLGQPLPLVGCGAPEPVTASEDANSFVEPGDFSDDLTRAARSIGQITTYDIVATDAIAPCDGTPGPRLVAW